MPKGYALNDPRIADYVERVFGGEDELLAEIRARQAAAGMPDIAVGALDGLHLEVLARATGAKKAVEIGTLGGYSGTRLLRGMGAGGYLHTFEFEPAHAAVARDTFARGGFGAQVTVHVGPAIDHLADIEPEAPFDLVFIDADKISYPLYLAWAGRHLREGGVVLADNAFLFGAIADEPAGSEAARVRAMQSFNDSLARGGRFRATMFPTGEGLAMGVKLR